MERVREEGLQDALNRALQEVYRVRSSKRDRAYWLILQRSRDRRFGATRCDPEGCLVVAADFTNEVAADFTNEKEWYKSTKAL